MAGIAQSVLTVGSATLDPWSDTGAVVEKTKSRKRRERMRKHAVLKSEKASTTIRMMLGVPCKSHDISTDVSARTITLEERLQRIENKIDSLLNWASYSLSVEQEMYRGHGVNYSMAISALELERQCAAVRTIQKTWVRKLEEKKMRSNGQFQPMREVSGDKESDEEAIASDANFDISFASKEDTGALERPLQEKSYVTVVPSRVGFDIATSGDGDIASTKLADYSGDLSGDIPGTWNGHGERKMTEWSSVVDSTTASWKLRRLCRGVGHVSTCQWCSHTTDRFGPYRKSLLCDRGCTTIDGVWGPTICCADCKPESVEPNSQPESMDLGTQRRVWKRRAQ